MTTKICSCEKLYPELEIKSWNKSICQQKTRLGFLFNVYKRLKNIFLEKTCL